MSKIVKYVVMMALVAPLFALTYFESSNGWGLPGDSDKISLVYGSVDGWNAAFQMMICFDPAVLQIDTFSLYGEGAASTLFDTVWGGEGPDYFTYELNNDQGYFRIAVLYDLTTPFDKALPPFDRTPLFLIKWSVSPSASIPTLVDLNISEDCGGVHTDCLFSDTSGYSIYTDTLIGGIYYVVPAGDANADGGVTYTDLANISNFLYGGAEVVPSPAADVNVSCSLDYIDMVFLANYLFMGGPPPLPPACPWKKWNMPDVDRRLPDMNSTEGIKLDGSSTGNLKETR